MKKLFLYVTMLALFVISCKSAPIVWDENIPEDQTASVYFYYVVPTSYNDVNVNWKSFYTVKIPGGESEFVVNVISDTYTINDAIFTYNFESPLEYTVRFGTKELEGGGGRLIVGVAIYKGINSTKEEALLDFIPFSNKNKK